MALGGILQTLQDSPWISVTQQMLSKQQSMCVKVASPVCHPLLGMCGCYRLADMRPGNGVCFCPTLWQG